MWQMFFVHKKLAVDENVYTQIVTNTPDLDKLLLSAI